MPTEIERLYREHRAGLVRLVERELHDRHDAEDVVQTAFLDAQRALERGTVPRNPSAWLATIALNAGRRLRRRRPNVQPLEEYAVQDASGLPEIRAALASLPREQRTAVVYRDVLGFSYGETAKRMGTSVNAVTMLLHRGRRHLRQMLGVTAGGIGLWRWVKRAGMPQVTVAKGSAALVVAAGLATTGVVAARVIAPIGADLPAAAMAAPAPALGSRSEERGRTPGGAPALASARRAVEAAGGSSMSAVPAQTQASGGEDATPASVRASTAETPPPSPPPATAPAPTLSLPTLTIPTPPVAVTVSTPIATVAVTASTGTTATVAVSTPIATVAVTAPTGTTATVTTPIATVTLPIP
ncbi:MAG TPA: sigma-70 family RNA polymerase sigma factor [Gaiellaceae bacterium]|nr:sigma-70 family RNA polymerase sigma factor [Gaiellaceae bacterium]